MKILVTGASGLVGKAIQNYITKQRQEQQQQQQQEQQQQHQFIFVSSKDADLKQKEQVDKLFEDNNYDSVIHLAACVGGIYKNMRNNVEMYLDNVAINSNVIKACHKYGVKRGIFCLSSCVYPANPPEFPMTEEMLHQGDPHDSNKGYAHAKRQLQVMCEIYNSQYKYEYICVSPVNLYGPHDNFNIEDGHIIPSVIHRMFNSIESRDFSLYGNGQALRQFVFSEDFAKAIILILLDSSVPIGTYNISDINENKEIKEYKIKEVIDIIADNLGFPKNLIKNDVSRSDGILKKTVSGEKFKKIYPDFTFTLLEDGLQTTCKWMVDNFDSIRK